MQYEPSVISHRTAAEFVVSVLVALGVVCALVRIHQWRLDANAGLGLPTTPGSPSQLETQAGQAWADYAGRSRAWLSSTGSIDQAHGVAHIPIDRAMDLVLQEGVQAP